jgi:hypothetical protein
MQAATTGAPEPNSTGGDGAARRVVAAETVTEELAAARRGGFIGPGPHLIDAGGAPTAALAITGPSTGELRDTRVRRRRDPARGLTSGEPSRSASDSDAEGIGNFGSTVGNTT